MKLMITGGGTGGHIFAGVAIAQEFLSQSKANQVEFIGSTQGLEVRLVPKAGFKLHTLNLGRLVGQSIFQRLLTLVQIPIAIIKAVLILKNFRPDFVIGVGGFAAGPTIIAAWLLKIPIGVLEQNSIMGFTNRISAKCADHVFLAFDEIPNGIDSKKCVYSGNPVRSGLKAQKKSNAKTTDDEKVFQVFAFGGSQGATGINKLLIDYL